jgi:hypothetical protein
VKKGEVLVKVRKFDIFRLKSTGEQFLLLGTGVPHPGGEFGYFCRRGNLNRHIKISRFCEDAEYVKHAYVTEFVHKVKEFFSY